LNYLVTLFANNILPIFLASAAGYLVARFLKVGARPVSQVTFYIFSPALVYNLLTSSQIKNFEALRMVGFTLAGVLVIGLMAWIIGRALHVQRSLLVALLLVVMFDNSGNFGLSLNLFAFGAPAMPYATIFFVTNLVLMYSLGVVLASLGTVGLRKAILSLFKVPVVYAAVLAMLMNRFGWQLSPPLERTVTILSSATIPLMLVLMGIQLNQSRINGQYLALGIANGLRLLVAPAIALGLSVLFRLSGPAYQAGVIQSAMPTAVVMTILATEYNIEPSFISSAVFTSTLLSPLTITPLLAYLGA
jgi:malate permease and related proteins